MRLMQAALHKEITESLKELKMPTVRESYRAEAEHARSESLSYERYLLELVRREAQTRRQNRIARLLRQSKLPLEKSLGAFDLGRLPLRLRQQVQVLLEGDFLDRRENICKQRDAFGNPGSGKTHLLCAIGQELVHQDRRVLFTTCSLLVQDLLKAKIELKLESLLRRLSRFEADLSAGQALSTTSHMSNKAVKRWKCSSPSWPTATNAAR